MKKQLSPRWFFMLVVLLTGGLASPIAVLAGKTDAGKAISEVVQIIESAQQQQYDVLAFEEFVKGKEILAEARLGIKEGYLPETIQGYTANAKATILAAIEKAKERKARAGRILDDRQAVLTAGVRKSAELTERLLEIDQELVDETDSFSESLDPDDFAEIQKKYYRLETRAIQFSTLHEAIKVIDQALEDDAEDVAPNTLRTAQLDYKTAMNKIDLSPRSPSIYKKSVDTALASAQHLSEVMQVIKGAEGTPEKIAIQIVKQQRALGKMSKLEADLKTTKQTLQKKDTELQQVDTVLKQKDEALKEKDTALRQTESALQQKDTELKQKEDVLKTQQEQLARASIQVRFQQAMDEARQVIPETDALVYQQGNKLVFRLKRINFPSGTADIPEISKLLISRVDEIIRKLDAQKVVVQGHTDSVGAADVNKRLSTKRATAVATYLYHLKGGYKITYAGYGESQPLASNETAAGRATNRRVDLVVSVKE